MLESSYNSLLTPVNPKSNIENKNRNEHGKRVLIGDVKLDESTIQLLFHIQGVSISDYLQNNHFSNSIRGKQVKITFSIKGDSASSILVYTNTGLSAVQTVQYITEWQKCIFGYDIRE